MTREKWKQMTPDQRRVKIAELCGWQNIHLCTWDDLHEHTSPFGDNGLDGSLDSPVGTPPQGSARDLLLIPRYEDSLDAVHEAIMATVAKKEDEGKTMSRFMCQLGNVVKPSWPPGTCVTRYFFQIDNATAAQRCEALVLTLEPE